MYYVVETNYVGPNQDQDKYIDVDTIDIRTCPAHTNMTNEPRTEGWCGTTNDWAVFAHGEYATIEEARAAIAKKFGEVRDSDPRGDCFEPYNEYVVEMYKPGKYAPMSAERAENWAYEAICSDVDADTTDERIDELVAEYEAQANSEGYTLGGGLKYSMHEYRQTLRDKKLEDED